MYKLINVFLFSLLCTGCFYQPVKFGVQDEVAGKNIERINQLSALRNSLHYKELAERLKSDLAVYSSNPYAITRIKNELADINSFQLLDIEEAISLDEQILHSQISDSDIFGNFYPKHNVANQQVLADQAYTNEFISIASQALKEKAKQRLEINQQLVSGKQPSKNNSYAFSFLKNHLETVQKDISSTVVGSADRYRILSRLIRAEYELVKLDSKYPLQFYTYFFDRQLPIERVDFSEINFLSLADYFFICFQKTGDIKFAEYALNTIYKPYVNLHNPSNRWKYNNLINEYISILIDANYQKKHYDEMLYYSSLNKSRMLLEEQLLYKKNQQDNVAISDLAINDGVIRNENGLPDKSLFKQQISNADAFVDFYVGGKYSSNSVTLNKVSESASMPLNARDFGAESADNPVENFIDDVIYITTIKDGKIQFVKKLPNEALSNLKRNLNASFSMLSNKNMAKNNSSVMPNKDMSQLISESDTKRQWTISPDKWLARHPLDFHLGIQGNRSVNLFTYLKTKPLSNLTLTGFFNPTPREGNLPGSEKEAEVIHSIFPNAKIFVREAASISALNDNAGSNIVHLSMHGAFNPNNPTASKLYFAGAQRGLKTDDPNALYAKDMGKYEALRERDLIFAAACETGKIVADQNNESELVGILRPLTANRNRNVILSLWKVDDEATKDFVSWFYTKLADIHEVSLAFNYAQNEVRNKFKHPYYWGAFYLSQSR